MKFPHVAATFLLISFYEQFSYTFAFSFKTSISQKLHGNILHASPRTVHTALHAKPRQPDDALIGKVVAKRAIYRLRPHKKDTHSPFAIEERQYFTITSHNSLQPISDKFLIFRGSCGKVETSDKIAEQIGQAIFTVDGLVGYDTKMSKECNLAMALYCMEHHDMMTGKGLQIGSEKGVGAVLSVVGGGIASNIRNIHTGDAPVPDKLETFTITHPDQTPLKDCIKNLGAVGFPASKAQVGVLNWNNRLNKSLLHSFDFIMGSDCVHHPKGVKTVVQLAHQYLKNEESTFLHIAPKNELSYELQYKLRVRMPALVEELSLKRIQLLPIVMDTLEDLEKFDAEEGRLAEFGKVKNTIFAAVMAGKIPKRAKPRKMGEPVPKSAPIQQAPVTPAPAPVVPTPSPLQAEPLPAPATPTPIIPPPREASETLAPAPSPPKAEQLPEKENPAPIILPAAPAPAPVVSTPMTTTPISSSGGIASASPKYTPPAPKVVKESGFLAGLFGTRAQNPVAQVPAVAAAPSASSPQAASSSPSTVGTPSTPQVASPAISTSVKPQSSSSPLTGGPVPKYTPPAPKTVRESGFLAGLSGASSQNTNPPPSNNISKRSPVELEKLHSEVEARVEPIIEKAVESNVEKGVEGDIEALVESADYSAYEVKPIETAAPLPPMTAKYVELELEQNTERMVELTTQQSVEK